MLRVRGLGGFGKWFKEEDSLPIVEVDPGFDSTRK